MPYFQRNIFSWLPLPGISRPVAPPSVSDAPAAASTLKVPSGVVFRVTSIPRDTTLDKLHDALSVFPALNKEQTTLCLSPDSRSLTALIHFSSPPPVLASLKPGKVHTCKLGGRTIAIDRDFYGLTQLYPTSNTAPISADIIAVCGLNGHAYGSWAGPPDDDGDRKMWLRHFLADDFPGCRTMIYGYDSNLSPDSHGFQRIPDYTDSFLEEVKKARRSEEEKKRGLVLVGHSFGGIIIAHALVKAKESDAVHEGIFRHTRATLFFGTPHRGFLVDDILAMVGGSSREALVQSLEKGSEELATELRRFINYSDAAKMPIVNFKETEKTRMVSKGTDGRWSRNGPFYTAVEAGSAILALPESLEKVLPVSGNHSTMVKFEHPGHSTYKSVIDLLEGFTGESNEPAPVPVTAYKAVMTGNPADLLRALEQHRVDINDLQGGGTTLLHLAVANGDKACTRILLDKGAKPGVQGQDGSTPLHLAVQKGCEWQWAIDMLLDNGADIGTMCAGQSVLHIAARTGDVGMVEYLLRQKGVDIGKQAADKNKFTALHVAAGAGHMEVAKLLIRSGADLHAVGQDGDTPLHKAAWEGQENLVGWLLDNGANMTLADRNGCTPLHFAAHRGHQGVVDFLIRAGADKTATDKSGRTALHIAALEGHVEVVALLLKRGFDVRSISRNNHTALHNAARKGRSDVVKLLLEEGADITAVDNFGDTPFDYAVRGGYSKVADILSQGRTITES